MIATHAAATDAAAIIADPESFVDERDAAQEVIDSYNQKRSMFSPTWVEAKLRAYINRRQQQDRYGKSL